jgi:integrase
VTHFCYAMLRSFSWTAAFGPKSAFACSGRIIRAALLKSRTARPTTPAGAFPSPSARSQSWRCGAKNGQGHGSSRHQQRAATLNRRVFRAGMARRASSHDWTTSPFYTFRHTCLTRWAPFMDPWTLAYLAGHRDMSITKRYVHPQEYNTRAAIEKARLALGGHSSGHSPIWDAQSQLGDMAVNS